MTEMTGGCACGAVRFKITQPFLGMGACFCTDCQKAAGGAPTYIGLAPRAAFEVTRGQAKVYSVKGDTGGEVGRAFCPDCGTPLWSLPGAEAPFVPVKIGALDDPSVFQPQMQIYTDSAQPWHLLHDGGMRFPKM